MGPNLHPRGKGLHNEGTNPCASETSDLELSNAQRFESISLTVASEYSIENPWFWEFPPKSEKTQNPNSSVLSNQDIFVVRQKCFFNPSALEGSNLLMFDAQEFRSISCAFAYIVCKQGWYKLLFKITISKKTCMFQTRYIRDWDNFGLESRCVRILRSWFYWRTLPRIHVFDILLVHAEIGMVENSVEIHDFSKIIHVQVKI